MSDYLQKLDKVQLEIKPLAKHAIVAAEKSFKGLYTTLLIASLQSSGVLTEAQERVLTLILESIKLEHAKEYYYALAASITEEQISVFFKDAKEKDKLAFLLDLMILLRLDGPLSATQQNLLAHISSIFALNNDSIQGVDFWAAIILGLPILSVPKRCSEDIYLEVSKKANRHRTDVIEFFSVDILVEFIVEKDCLLFYSGENAEKMNTNEVVTSALILNEGLEAHNSSLLNWPSLSWGGKSSDSKIEIKHFTIEKVPADGIFIALVVKGERIECRSEEYQHQLGVLIKFPNYISAWQAEISANPQLEQNLKQLIKRGGK